MSDENNSAQNVETTNDSDNGEAVENDANEVEKTFTQTEVNSLLADNKRKLLAKYEDYDSLKATVDGLDDIKSQSFQDGQTQATNELLGRLIDTEIRSSAQALGFADPSDAITFFGDKTEITYDTEKGLDHEAITSRLGDLATNKPYLLKTEQVNGATSRPKPKTAETVIKPEEPADRISAALRQLKL